MDFSTEMKDKSHDQNIAGCSSINDDVNNVPVLNRTVCVEPIELDVVSIHWNFTVYRSTIDQNTEFKLKQKYSINSASIWFEYEIF